MAVLSLSPPHAGTRQAGPLSASGQAIIGTFGHHLNVTERISAGTRRASLADVTYSAVWCEAGAASLNGQPFVPDHISTALLTRYRDQLQGPINLQAASVNRALLGLKRFCAWAAQTALIGHDPARSVRYVRLADVTPRGLSDQDAAALSRSVTRSGRPRDQALVLLMLHTGLRAAEICRLRASDLTLGTGTGALRVTSTAHKVREVPLDAAAQGALIHVLQVPPPDKALLFPSTRPGEALSPRALGLVIRKYGRLTQLDIGAHQLRHRYGYVMAQQVPLQRLAQLMGHESLDTTALYTHPAWRPQAPTTPVAAPHV